MAREKTVEQDGIAVSFKARLPEAHVRHVARMVLDGLGRHSQDAEDWVVEQGWFRRWVAVAAAEMVEFWLLQHGWEADPALFWPDQPKDIWGAEDIAHNLKGLRLTRL